MLLFSDFFYWQVVDALELSRATMSKVYQNLSWAIAYNVVAVPIAAGVLLPQYDFAMTPSLSGPQNSIIQSIFFYWNGEKSMFHAHLVEYMPLPG
jgi:Cu+-exporting ATPase